MGAPVRRPLCGGLTTRLFSNRYECSRLWYFGTYGIGCLADGSCRYRRVLSKSRSSFRSGSTFDAGSRPTFHLRITSFLPSSPSGHCHSHSRSRMPRLLNFNVFCGFKQKLPAIVKQMLTPQDNKIPQASTKYTIPRQKRSTLRGSARASMQHP